VAGTLAPKPAPVPNDLSAADELAAPRRGPSIAGSPFDSWPNRALAQGAKDPTLAGSEDPAYRWSPGSFSDRWSPGSSDPGKGRRLRAGTAVRQVPATYVPGVPLAVTLTVTPDGDVQAWAVEETVPAGWRVTAISADGHWDEKAGVVRWGPFFDEPGQTLRYTLTPPAGAFETRTLRGTASFDGADVVVAGASTIQRAASIRPGDGR